MELTEENVNRGIGYMQHFTAPHGRSIQLVEIESGTNIIKVRFGETGHVCLSDIAIESILELIENYFKEEFPDCAGVVQVL